VTEANTDERDEVDAGIPHEVTDETATPGRRPRRRIDKGLLGLSLVIAFGLVLIVRGIAISITGDERSKLPDAVEEVDPVPEAVQVLNQTQVYADLAFGYTGVFVIDGVELPTVDIGDVAASVNAEPGQQVDVPPDTIYEAGNATLTFLPSDRAAITEFTSGLHRVQLVYWKIEDGRGRARTFTWTFNAV
jgi:hypothetical protein